MFAERVETSRHVSRILGKHGTETELKYKSQEQEAKNRNQRNMKKTRFRADLEE